MKQMHPEPQFRVQVRLHVGEVFYAGQCAYDKADDEDDESKSFSAFRFVFGGVHFGMV